MRAESERGVGPPDLRHLFRMTDDTGMLQHARHGIPDRRHGYTTDDNARALLVALKLQEVWEVPRSRELAELYLSFLGHAQREDGGFRNFMDYQRRFLPEEESEDCFGRCLWALAAVLGSAGALGDAAQERLEWALPRAAALRFLRGQAHAVRALALLVEARFALRRTRPLLRKLSGSLLDAYREACRPDWRWFEPEATYGNADLPHALLLAWAATGDERYRQAGTQTLDFLLESVWTGKLFRPVGNRGWWRQGEAPARYDQQPLEAGTTADACLTAYRLTGEERYRRAAAGALAWFHGRNSRKVDLYDAQTGGCRDGITPAGANRNQGAESLLSMLWAQLVWTETVQRREETPVYA
ncbi:MAG: glycosyltransferase [Thermaerobacter sp.]|nr:glycosyltransferase [Thermaerobacter sp.]